MTGHIQEAELQLRRLVDRIREKPGIPEELVQELVQAAWRLTAHVGELRFLKSKLLDETWTTWEHSA